MIRNLIAYFHSKKWPVVKISKPYKKRATTHAS